MSRSIPFLASLATLFAASWLALVAAPYLQLGRLTPATDSASGATSPSLLSGPAVEGQRVYAANGCASCHTQQIRPLPAADLARRLGPRPTVARDFLREQPAFPGNLRIGPDLANAGALASDPNWFHRHLYEPSAATPGSNMPAYRFLYRLRKITGQPSPWAISGLIGPHAPPPGYEVLPTAKAKALVAYLQSLKRDYPLPEAATGPAQPITP